MIGELIVFLALAVLVVALGVTLAPYILTAVELIPAGLAISVVSLSTVVRALLGILAALATLGGVYLLLDRARARFAGRRVPVYAQALLWLGVLSFPALLSLVLELASK
jgi:hypothetical protein